MYSFIDTTESQGSADLPSEALKLNGEYIENQIEGYRTLYVTGREILPQELTTYETGVRDGSNLSYRRYPSRTITVGYQLIAEDNESFREAYNKLNALLDVEDAEMIFADEPDKFFRGTPSGAGDVDPGKNAVKGEIEFTCTDPFKYSVEEYEASPVADDGTTFVIEYNGTQKSYPAFEVSFADQDESEGALTGNGDCGFVVFMNEDQKVIQVGEPEETDGETYEKSQTLVNQTFDKWDSSVTKNWAVNTGANTNPEVHKQMGSIKLTTYGSYQAITANSFGSYNNAWHGPTVTRIIPADASGEQGAINWQASWKQLMSISQNTNGSKEKGVFQCLLNNVSGSTITTVAAVAVWKSTAGNKATIRFYVHGQKNVDVQIDISWFNKYFGWTGSTGPVPTRTSTIQKKGDTITFNIAGIKRAFTSPAVADMEVHHMTFWFGQYGTATPLYTNGLIYAKFIKDNCDTWQDIPNKFSANDVLMVDCESAQIYLNDIETPELGALGNDWDDFYLKPGTNQIGVAWSDWTTNNPTFKIKYREAFL